MKKILLMFFVLVCFCGCNTFHPPMPESWGKISKKSECPRLDGTYYNRGEVNNPYDHPSLSGSIFDIPLDAMFITLKQSENELLIKDNSNTLRTVPFNSHDCRNGFLKFESFYPPSVHTSKQFPSIGYDTISIKLAKGEDGSIIVLEDYKSSGFFLFIPSFHSRYTWFRFPKSAD